MSYVAAAIVIGTGVNMYGNIQEGKAKKAEAYDAARQLERERELTKVQATQSMTAMAQDYAMATSANEAFFAGVLGRDVSDRSLRAFKQRQEEIYSTDVKRLASDTNMRAKTLTDQASSMYRSGKNAQKASYIKATQSFMQGIYSYQGVGGGNVPMDSGSMNPIKAGQVDRRSSASSYQGKTGYTKYLVRSS